jgi:predicted helicase
MPYQWPSIIPLDKPHEKTISICFPNVGNTKPFHVLATDTIADLHLTGDSQCLPRYRYEADGTRVDNITDWALAQFRAAYPDAEAGALTKDLIFHYTYAVLHDPRYRERYALNLKREFPRLPFHPDIHRWAELGRQLMELHIGFEAATPYALERHDLTWDKDRAPKPLLRINKTNESVIELDEQTTLRGLPPEAHQYRLGNRSAVAWVLDQYKEKKPSDPTIREHFNTYRFADHKAEVIELLRRVTTVSVETVRLVADIKALPASFEGLSADA